MALEIEARTDSGLSLSYHRISQIDIETNIRVGVWVRSYVNASERQREMDGEVAYHEDCYYSTEGPEGPMTVEEAYAWLKSTRPEFAEAEDC